MHGRVTRPASSEHFFPPVARVAHKVISVVTPRLHVIFQACDADASGNLDLPQSQFALQALGFYPTERELKAAVKALDLDFPLTSPALLQKVG